MPGNLPLDEKRNTLQAVSNPLSLRVERAEPAQNRNLARFAWIVVFYNILVVLWGALVRASGSGAGCGNHWPLCNGQVIPVSPGTHTMIEFTHRMMTGGLTFAVLGLVGWIFWATKRGHAARFFAVASLVLLLNEAFLGALLVKLDYVTTNQSTGRVVMLAIHLSNTLLLLTALTLTARFASATQSWRSLNRGRWLGWAICGAAATLAVGVTGSLAALGDTLFPAGSLTQALTQDFRANSPVLLKLRLVHPLSAIIAGLFVVWLVVRAHATRNTPDPTRAKLARLLLLILGFQFLLGIADVLLLAPAWMQLIHLLGADLYWVVLILLSAETVWPESWESPATNEPSPKMHEPVL